MSAASLTQSTSPLAGTILSSTSRSLPAASSSASYAPSFGTQLEAARSGSDTAAASPRSPGMSSSGLTMTMPSSSPLKLKSMPHLATGAAVPPVDARTMQSACAAGGVSLKLSTPVVDVSSNGSTLPSALPPSASQASGAAPASNPTSDTSSVETFSGLRADRSEVTGVVAAEPSGTRRSVYHHETRPTSQRKSIGEPENAGTTLAEPLAEPVAGVQAIAPVSLTLAYPNSGSTGAGSEPTTTSPVVQADTSAITAAQPGLSVAATTVDVEASMPASAPAISDATPHAVGSPQTLPSNAASAQFLTPSAQHDPGAMGSIEPTTVNLTPAVSSAGKPSAAVTLSRSAGGLAAASTGTRGVLTTQSEPHGRHEVHDEDPGALAAGVDPSTVANPAVPASDAATTTTGDQGSPVDMTQSTAASPMPVLQTSASVAAETAYGTSAPAQVGAALVRLTPQADGSSRLAVSLQPKDLGSVQIQVERSADGAVRVVVAADEPATLRSLMTSQAHLHAALDAASVPATNRHLSFELSNAASPMATTSHPNTPSNAGRQQDTPLSQEAERPQASDMSGFRNSEQSDRGNAQDQRESPNQNRTAVRTMEPLADLPLAIAATERGRRFGNINITA